MLMGIDLSQIHLLITALLPVLVAFVAGILRQDRLPQLVNEAISYALVIVVALVNALLDGKLGGSSYADFLIVAAYASASLHAPLFQALQQYLQSTIFSFGRSPAAAPVQPQAQASVDVQALAQELLKAFNMPSLAFLLAQEVAKIRVAQTAPQQQKPIEQRPTVATQAVQPPQAPTSRGG